MDETEVAVGVGGSGVKVEVKVGSGVQVGMGVGGSAVQKTGCVGVAVRVGSVVPHSGPQAESIPVRSSKTAALRMVAVNKRFIREDYTAASPSPLLLLPSGSGVTGLNLGLIF